ncbi:SDR family NAD(P)-dependent oxidoreductase [Marisediminicola senii]|uniref:SDR family NAD(P)-dependent oxidoreductase n=1 Tax=Marisediminicola senii TaxID=2711233 RepID=UPI0013EAE399|nr:SDR family NAD(P)-dependent oxidoreductase [Marisediminicola senii]
MQLAGTVALVTGGASGLGLATAITLRAAGATVVIVDLPGSGGEAIAREHDLVFTAADVVDAAQLATAIDTATALGPLRTVVCCAGIAPVGKVVGRNGPLPLEDFDRVIRVNLSGTFNTVRLAAAAMQPLEPVGEERGVIVMTASVAAFDGQVGQPAYAASKAGVAGMTLPVARELAAHRIRVMTIAPGTFETPMLAALPDAARASLAGQAPHPSRLGKPAEFAALVEHIVRNPMLNGETIRLDGAIRMAPR